MAHALIMTSELQRLPPKTEENHCACAQTKLRIKLKEKDPVQPTASLSVLNSCRPIVILINLGKKMFEGNYKNVYINPSQS